jgi:hypothetical protein
MAPVCFSVCATVACVIRPCALIPQRPLYSQLKYVYIARYETGGAMWERAFNRLFASVAFAQLCLVGQFLLYRNLLFLYIVPLPFITIGVCFVCFRKR